VGVFHSPMAMHPTLTIMFSHHREDLEVESRTRRNTFFTIQHAMSKSTKFN
jgi:hypothetical protein